MKICDGRKRNGLNGATVLWRAEEGQIDFQEFAFGSKPSVQLQNDGLMIFQMVSRIIGILITFVKR